MKIKRARGHRLYTVDGKKIIDLSMDRGRAVIGHRPNGLSLTLKNSIDRGIYAAYDNIYVDRLVKYINKTFVGYDYVTILDNEYKVADFFKCDIADPLTDDANNAVVSYWRPFLDNQKCDNLVLLYPLPGLNSISVLISKEKHSLKSDKVSPVLLSGILRSFYDYDAEVKDFTIDNFHMYKNIKNTTLKPPYLVLDIEDEDYKKLYEEGLKAGILLNDTKQFLVLTSDFSKGEVSQILNLLN